MEGEGGDLGTRRLRAAVVGGRRRRVGGGGRRGRGDGRFKLVEGLAEDFKAGKVVSLMMSGEELAYLDG